MYTYFRAWKLTKPPLVQLILRFGSMKKIRLVFTDVSIPTCPASKTTHQGGRRSGIFVPCLLVSPYHKR